MRLRIAIVNRHLYDGVGGSELQCDLYARDLSARDHDVTYIAVQSRLATKTTGESEPFPYTLIPLDDEATSPAGIARAVRAASADVVYWRLGREFLAEVVTALQGPGGRVPVVLAVAHVNDITRWPALPLASGGVRDRGADLRWRLDHRRSWRAFRRIAAIAAQREDFLGRVPVARQEHIPNIVDPSFIPFAWPRPYVAWVANLKPRKRPEQLVPLARALAQHGLDLLVAGAVQDARYASLTDVDPPQPNLHVLGALPPAEAAGLIAGARCLAITVRPEGLSNAMTQAWWHGVPTVSLEYDPDGAIAAEGLGAVCGDDPVAFRVAVIAYADDSEDTRAAGLRAKAYARARFARERNVDLLEDLLVDIVRTHLATRR
jgi:glycosyltransferase involved in cell wall biosynthesis